MPLKLPFFNANSILKYDLLLVLNPALNHSAQAVCLKSLHFKYLLLILKTLQNDEEWCFLF